MWKLYRKGFRIYSKSMPPLWNVSRNLVLQVQSKNNTYIQAYADAFIVIDPNTKRYGAEKKINKGTPET